MPGTESNGQRPTLRLKKPFLGKILRMILTRKMHIKSHQSAHHAEGTHQGGKVPNPPKKGRRKGGMILRRMAKT